MKSVTEQKDTQLALAVFVLAMTDTDVLEQVDAKDFDTPMNAIIETRKSGKWDSRCDSALKTLFGVDRGSDKVVDAMLKQFRFLNEWRRQNREQGKVNWQLRVAALLAAKNGEPK